MAAPNLNAVDSDNLMISLEWNLPADTFTNQLTHYQVYYKTEVDEDFKMLYTTTSSLELDITRLDTEFRSYDTSPNVETAETYQFYVAAVGENGPGHKSSTLSVKTDSYLK